MRTSFFCGGTLPLGKGKVSPHPFQRKPLLSDKLFQEIDDLIVSRKIIREFCCEMLARRFLRPAAFAAGIDAMTAADGDEPEVFQSVVLAEMATVLAGLGFHS